MKRHSAVIFPETVPDEQVLAPLVPVFQPLVYCQPVEGEVGEEEEGRDSLCDELLQHTLCRRVVPAPLGSDRARFSRLLSDIRYRRDDYAAQLTHVSLTALGATGKRKAETKSSIVSELLKSQGIKSERRDGEAMLLWQARLVLKLGEFMDEDQRELAKKVQTVTEREKGLFAALRQEPEGLFSRTEILSTVSVEDTGMQRLLLKAWSRIFAFGSSSPVQERVFVTRNSDAVDRLGEEYERINGERPREIIRLLLPAQMTGDETIVEVMDRFSRDAGHLLEDLYGILNGSSGNNDLLEKFTAPGEDSWDAAIEKHFPADACGRREMTLYDFGSVSPRQLFLNSFGFDEDILQPEPSDKAASGVVIGVLVQMLDIS